MGGIQWSKPECRNTLKTGIIRELKQPRRLRLIKRHLKINICAMVTILQLLIFLAFYILLKMDR